jgi:hypothetical protein
LFVKLLCQNKRQAIDDQTQYDAYDLQNKIFTQDLKDLQIVLEYIDNDQEKCEKNQCKNKYNQQAHHKQDIVVDTVDHVIIFVYDHFCVS